MSDIDVSIHKNVLSERCTTGVIKAVVCAILSVG